MTKPLFEGELMQCFMCRKEQRHVPGDVSDWRVIEIEGQRFYFCPTEFPPDGSSMDDFQKAYKRILGAINGWLNGYRDASSAT